MQPRVTCFTHRRNDYPFWTRPVLIRTIVSILLIHFLLTDSTLSKSETKWVDFVGSWLSLLITGARASLVSKEKQAQSTQRK